MFDVRLRIVVAGVVFALLTAGGASADVGCESVRGVFLTTPRRNITIKGEGAAVPLRVRVANTVVRRTAALRCATVASLEEAPVLFDYDEEFVATEPLIPVPASVDVAHIKDDGRIIAITRTHVEGGTVAPPAGAFRYVLEVPGGFFEKHGIRPGGQATLR